MRRARQKGSALGTNDPYYLYEPRRPDGVLLIESQADFGAIASSLRAIVRARDPSVAFRVLPLAANSHGGAVSPA